MENFNNEPTLFDLGFKAGDIVAKQESVSQTPEIQNTGENALKCFENVKFGKVRVLGDSENPLFCLADICKILELSTPAKIADMVKTEFECYELNSYHLTDALGRKQKATFISEPQLYFVLMQRTRGAK